MEAPQGRDFCIVFSKWGRGDHLSKDFRKISVNSGIQYFQVLLAKCSFPRHRDPPHFNQSLDFDVIDLLKLMAQHLFDCYYSYD